MKDSSRRVRVDPLSPDAEVIEQAVSIVRSGGVVVFPTQVLYGLAADALDPAAVARVYDIKRRAAAKPISVLISRPDRLLELVAEIPESAKKIIDRLWPGGVTLVFSAKPGIPGSLTGQSGKIGIRLPLHPMAAVFCRAVDIPITATSANISGFPGCSRIEALPESIIAEADMVLDAGPLPGGVGSTVVDVTVDPPRILREGVIPAAQIRAALQT